MSRRKGLGERIRWRIADLLNRLPGQCWSGLVDWVLDEPEDRRRGLPWSPNTQCRQDVFRGACYCGKIRQPEPAATGGDPS